MEWGSQFHNLGGAQVCHQLNSRMLTAAQATVNQHTPRDKVLLSDAHTVDTRVVPKCKTNIQGEVLHRGTKTRALWGDESEISTKNSKAPHLRRSQKHEPYQGQDAAQFAAVAVSPQCRCVGSPSGDVLGTTQTPVTASSDSTFLTLRPTPAWLSQERHDQSQKPFPPHRRRPRPKTPQQCATVNPFAEIQSPEETMKR